MTPTLFRELLRAFNEDKAMRLASSIAFSAIFALAPLLIVLIAIAGWALGMQNGGHGHHVAEDALLDGIRRSAGNATAETIHQLITASFNRPRQGMVAQILGWCAFLFGAAALFSTLRDSLNTIWHVESAPGGWKQTLRERVISFVLILAFGFLLLVTLVAGAGIAFVVANLGHTLPIGVSSRILGAANAIVTFAVATVAFAVVYKTLPDVAIDWRHVWLGAAVTAMLFMAGEAAIAYYLAVAGVASAYGAAGAPLVALLWIYYSAVILLAGAEFTKISAGRARVAPGNAGRLAGAAAGADPPAASQRPG
ncbi:MAG: YihY/virulence factor BrkB family protein [Candidatus Tumulicola sp.]